jgi:ribosomal protein L35AE/L33A
MRAETVFMAIENLNHGKFEFASTETGVGEAAARLAGLKDGSEEGRWRGVLLSVRDPTKIPTGRFYQRAWIYDATVDVFEGMVRTNDNPNTFLIPIRSTKSHGAVFSLAEWFDKLLENGTTFGGAVFITHGDSGVIRFDGSDLNVKSLGLYFAGHAYETLFPGTSRLYFAGCDVADGDEGWKFLEKTGQVFLKRGGGISYGWTSLGFAVPSWFAISPGHAVHLWGDVRGVRITRDGQVAERFGD